MRRVRAQGHTPVCSWQWRRESPRLESSSGQAARRPGSDERASFGLADRALVGCRVVYRVAADRADVDLALGQVFARGQRLKASVQRLWRVFSTARAKRNEVVAAACSSSAVLRHPGYVDMNSWCSPALAAFTFFFVSFTSRSADVHRKPVLAAPAACFPPAAKQAARGAGGWEVRRQQVSSAS